jgi:signal peptidase I
VVFRVGSLHFPAVAKPVRRGGGRRRGWIIYWVLLGVTILALVGSTAAVLTTGRVFTEPSTSMANTIRSGDVVVVARTTQVRRGDVIVEQQTVPSPGNYVRRVIGLPGDHVACCDAHGRITVNGEPLGESYLYPGNAPSEVRFKVTVPKGQLWLLGDHRRVSYDSRELGPLTVRVAGRVILVWHGGHLARLHTPHTFVADGLAPASEGTPPTLTAAVVAVLACLLLVVLVIIGIVCYVIGRIRRRRKPQRPSPAMNRPVTLPPAQQ